MITAKYLFRHPLVIISVLIISAIIVSMGISDIYYTKLENDYPLLMSSENINGIITSLKDHHDYTYLEVDSSVKRLIRPTCNTGYNPSNFNDFVAIGDKFIHEKLSKKIEIVKNNKSYSFDLIENIN